MEEVLRETVFRIEGDRWLEFTLSELLRRDRDGRQRPPHHHDSAAARAR